MQRKRRKATSRRWSITAPADTIFPATYTDTINVSGGGLFYVSGGSDANGSSYVGAVNLNSSNGTAAGVASGDGSFRFGNGHAGSLTSSGPLANTVAAGIELVNSGTNTLTITASAGNTLNIVRPMVDLAGLVRVSPSSSAAAARSSSPRRTATRRNDGRRRHVDHRPRRALAPQPIDANKFVSGMSEILRRTLGHEIEVETILAGGLWRTHVDGNRVGEPAAESRGECERRHAERRETDDRDRQRQFG